MQGKLMVCNLLMVQTAGAESIKGVGGMECTTPQNI